MQRCHGFATILQYYVRRRDYKVSNGHIDAAHQQSQASEHPQAHAREGPEEAVLVQDQEEEYRLNKRRKCRSVLEVEITATRPLRLGGLKKVGINVFVGNFVIYSGVRSTARWWRSRGTAAYFA
eukprot:TRINITY_DN41555_c0_g1_i1.p1 TRINITY_DN41555_c0_g1~~TRINITY_DN41555_c0_g1_i1.p1  ORF type:complete len:124 (-),score=19.51 TRINITY_DN41555_c0_g1_i1:114-485(-)